jgi:hypothetical protein
MKPTIGMQAIAKLHADELDQHRIFAGSSGQGGGVRPSIDA